MVAKKKIKIAISKGSLLVGAIEFLKEKNVEILGLDNKRKLILETKLPKGFDFDEIEILLVRGHDVPVYVDHGAADLGIVGSDVILDSKTNVIQLKDLDYGQCRLCVCAPKGKFKSLSDLPSYTRVATTFPVISKNFFDVQGLDIEIINLYGSVELGPLTGLSDVIVDLVASGKTLEENGLEVIHEIMPCTARLIASQAAFKLYKHELLKF